MVCCCSRLLRCAFCLLSYRKSGGIPAPTRCIHHNRQCKAVLSRLHHLDELLGGALQPYSA